MQTKPFSIAIDGPAGAGKSTMAKALARELNAMYLDTGAMYRAFGLYMLRKGATNDTKAIIAALDEVDISVKFVDGAQRMFLGDEDVTDAIRTPEVTALVSKVAQLGPVREKMVELQRGMAKDGGVVMDGRDIASNVLPNADVKIFLTASIEERALRRWKEMKAKGYEEPMEKLAAEIEARDKADSERAISPLVRVPEATLLDTTGMTIDEVVQKVMELCG